MKRYIKASWPVIVDDRDFAEDLIAIAETVGVYEDEELTSEAIVQALDEGKYRRVDILLHEIDKWIQEAEEDEMEDADFIGEVYSEWDRLSQYRLDHEDNVESISSSQRIFTSEYVVMVRNRGMWGFDTYCKDENGRPMKFLTREQAQAVADKYNSERGPVNNFNYYYVEER